MSSDILLVYPIINVIVTGLFAGVVLRQYLRRHRTYQFFWAIALLMAIYSAWQVKRRQGSGTLFGANILILAGTLIIALAGTTARLGVKNIFWLVMALGWTVFFIGVLLTSRARRPAIPAKQEGQQNNVGALHSTT